MLKLIKYFRKRDIFLLILVIGLIVLQVFLELRIPEYMSKITELVTQTTDIKGILTQGYYMMGCALLSLVTSVIMGFIFANSGTAFGAKLREVVFKKVGTFNMTEIKLFSTSSLITRTTNDVSQVQSFLTMGLQLLIKSPIMAIWAITKIANKGFEFSIITAIGLVLILTLIIILVIIVLPKFKIVQKLTDNLNARTRENITGIRVIRAFNAENYQYDRFQNANTELTKTHLFVQKRMALMSPFMSLVMSSISLAIYVVGANLINAADFMDKITIFGDMVVFSSYAVQVIMSFMLLVLVFVLYPRASVSANRINEVLNTKLSIIDGKKILTKKDKIDTITFKNVSFKYPDAEEYILKDINFEAKKGEMIAFIGSTGSGKSTLINLLPRFYDVNEGSILLNDINIKDIKLSSLYDKIGYIPQKSVMFKGSIKDNIRFGKVNNKKVKDELVKEAIDIAQASEFVNTLDDKLDYQVAQGGTNLSGGQKQRLAIARSIAREPEIYIFDDSFSALDYKTDYNLRKALRKFTSDATIFVVAQRIGTILNADKIVVLDNGEVVGIGTHQELYKNCQVYQEICNSQLSKEELTNAS